jgi:cytochrome c-type biogenesis protein CcmF
MIIADVDVLQHGKMLWPLHPAKLIYKKQPEAAQTEAAIGHGFRDDVYLALGTVNPSNKLAALQVHINPLVTWIWIGCFLILIPGSIVCMWPQFELGESRVWTGARGVAATAASVILGIMLAATPAFGQSMGSDDMDGLVHIENDAERAVFGKLRCPCGSCTGRSLADCSCGNAEQARERVREQMRARETEDQIVTTYVAEHGHEYLVVPENKGALRAIYAVPVVGIALGAYGLARLLRRWRSNDGSGGSKPPAANAPKDAYDTRLDDELKDLDD